MSKKSHWTPSAQTIVKKADTRYRKRLKTAEDRHNRLEARHKRLGIEIAKATEATARIKKEGVVLTPAEKKLKAKEEAKVACIISMHDKQHKSFADIGTALKISHAWAHAVYVQHKGGPKPKAKSPKKAVKAKKVVSKTKKVASKKSKPVAKAKAASKPSTKKAVGSSPKKQTKPVKKDGKRAETPAISASGSWNAGDEA